MPLSDAVFLRQTTQKGRTSSSRFKLERNFSTDHGDDVAIPTAVDFIPTSVAESANLAAEAAYLDKTIDRFGQMWLKEQITISSDLLWDAFVTDTGKLSPGLGKVLRSAMFTKIPNGYYTFSTEISESTREAWCDFLYALFSRNEISQVQWWKEVWK